MIQSLIRSSVALAILCSGNLCMANEKDAPTVREAIDWPVFLRKHDMVWEKLPRIWNDAPFLGNGMMGTMVRQTGESTMRWDVGRGDVQDHRTPGKPQRIDGEMFNTCRLPIGFFELKTVGKITGGSMRLDLWNAEATGELITDKGSIRWRSLVHAEEMLILTELSPSEGEKACRWRWQPEPAVSPRHTRKNTEGYPLNPPPTVEKEGALGFCTQGLLAGGETVTAWTEKPDDERRTLLVSVAHSYPERTARAEAQDVVTWNAEKSVDELVESHRAWWHAYYSQSFVSFPDAEWESFYWIQMYKLGSATRADRMLIDNQGPWLQPTAWPGAWWDLNVQLTYWPTYASNRLALGQSLNRALFDHVDNLIANVEPQYRHDSAAIDYDSGQYCVSPVLPPNDERPVMMGLLLWGLHNCWLYYRCTMDDAVLRDDLLPLLKRAVNYYYHFMTEDDAGTLHLPPAWSPEFKIGGRRAVSPDTNFDLSLVRWGCQTLIQSCERLGIEDPLLPKWKDTLENLVDYPTDENGFMVSTEIPFNTRHRHYSHLLMVYPLYLVNADQEEATRELAWKSVQHWQSFGASHGYALTGASSMASAFGRGNEALANLKKLRSHISPTTMYAELRTLPVIETPLSGAQSIHDMLLQSWGDTIRVFPAVPDEWQDVVIHDMRAEGAFLVSARRSKGRTDFVRIKSLAGEPCRIRHSLEGEVQVAGPRGIAIKEIEPGLIELTLSKNEEVILWSGNAMSALLIAPVSPLKEKPNSFGLKSGGDKEDRGH